MKNGNMFIFKFPNLSCGKEGLTKSLKGCLAEHHNISRDWHIDQFPSEMHLVSWAEMV